MKLIDLYKIKINSNLLKLFIYFRKFIISNFNLGSGPDFLIIGAQKAGTTSLFNYIKKYGSNFIAPIRKEIRFFTKEYNKGINYYRSFFPLKKKNGQITGEATPTYLFFHKCPRRVYKYYPNIKIIVILRNPIERAYSQYNFIKYTNRTPGNEPLSFKKALEQEGKRIDFNNIESFDDNYKRYSYKAKGLYYYQLKRWFKYYSREQFLIIESSDFFQNTQKVLNETFKFIGIRCKSGKELRFKIYNKNEYPPIDNETKKHLSKYFKLHNQKLYDLLGTKYDWDNN